MRIIGGNLKGRTILPPSSFKARPTTDFAKEGLFNTLAGMIDFEEVSLLDLFSGTGSISYEFASRGCKDIVSVEMNPLHSGFIKKTVHALGISGMQAVRHNVFDFLGICTKKFDVVFADPPYDISGFGDIPAKILGKDIFKDGGFLVFEHPGSYDFSSDPRFIKTKKYGNVHFTFFDGGLLQGDVNHGR